MRVYLRNTPAKFHPDPIRNNWALGFFEDGRPKKKNNKNRMGSDQFSLIKKIDSSSDSSSSSFVLCRSCEIN